MKKEYSIEDFKIAYGEKEMIAQGKVTNGELNINYSSILTKLIQEAGRWCERFASDLFIDWKQIDNELGHGAEHERSYLFGFRMDGVDHTPWVLTRFSQNNYTYRAIWRLDIKEIDKSNAVDIVSDIEMRLYRVW